MIILAVVVVLAGGLAALEATDTTHFFHKVDKTFVTTPNTSSRTTSNDKGETTGQSTNQSTNEPSHETKDKNDSSANSSAPLKTPTGTFVSNHHPNLSGSPAPNQIQSVCATTSGAQCQILFTKDGVTKSLPTQTTDRGGAAYWTWKLQDVGLTAGSWKVQAKATLGSQTQTADDAATLEVSQ